MRTTSLTCLVRHTAGVLVVAAAGVIAPRIATAQDAQSVGTIAVTVQDSTGEGIAGTELTVTGTAIHGYTDDAGRAKLVSIPSGTVRLAARRLGFRPDTIEVAVGPQATVATTLRLTATAQMLSAVYVRASAVDLSRRFGGFYARRQHGLGTFITRADLERTHSAELTDALRTVPGVHIMAGSGAIQHHVRMRGDTKCAPLVWLDGAPAGAAEFDLDAISPESVEGIEVYNGLSEVPSQFMLPMGGGSCGVVAVWTREGERAQKKSKHAMSPAQLAELVDALKVFTAEQVDVPARPDTSVHVHPAYPDSLFFAGTGGEVRAEFVVDSAGRVEMDTFNAVTSTNPAFTAAVRRALPGAAYIPALRRGHHVQQVVHQPFTFIPDSTFRHGHTG